MNERMNEQYHFCTYFDKNYLVRGLALYSSLVRYCKHFTFYVLCLDEPTYEILSSLSTKNIKLISLEEIEYEDEDLLTAKKNRTTVEYYFTCTPSLPLYILNHFKEINIITYLDADLYFFKDPSAIFLELGNNSILIVEHHYHEKYKEQKIYGIFNVGVLSFRNDIYGKECLNWWRKRCLEWCYDRVENGKFADQKYLDDWPNRFSKVAVVKDKGINLAMWNIVNYDLKRKNGKTTIDENTLTCFHFHGLKMITSIYFDLGGSPYGVNLNKIIKKYIFFPYLKELRSIGKRMNKEKINSIRYKINYTYRDIINLLIYGHNLLILGPLFGEVHLEKFLYPILYLKKNISKKFKSFCSS
jgi:hypothetical protein